MILVTGGSGYFARRLYELYPFMPFLAFARNEERLRQVREAFSVDTYCGDIANINSLKRLRQRYDITQVYHLAAMKQVPACEAQPEEAFRTNVLGTQNLLDVFHDIPLRMISSDKAFEPINAYGMSKALAEKLVASSNQSFMRFGNILGSTGSIFPIWIDKIKWGNPITVCKKCTRFFITSRDAVEAFVNDINFSAKSTETKLTYRRSFSMLDAAGWLLREFSHMGYRDSQINLVNPRPGDKIHESLNDYTCSKDVDPNAKDWIMYALKSEGLL